MQNWAIAIHGGAGHWMKRDNHLALQPARLGLRRALAMAADILNADGDALTAALAAVRVLEDEPWFNAGIGAALTEAGSVEHDAGIMRGSDGACGAVASVRRLRSPIEAARRVLDDGRHVLLCGEGAEVFARAAGCEEADPEMFITEQARADLQRWLAHHDPTVAKGTVGAVVRDNAGQLIAATSTGGLTGKRCGRIGDSPIPGGGTWADRHCAISSTLRSRFRACRKGYEQHRRCRQSCRLLKGFRANIRMFRDGREVLCFARHSGLGMA
jgi:beta-aspartyl-peptidase (threonine type)